MLLPDVNVLVYAFRPDAPRHEDYAAYVQAMARSESAFGLSDLVCNDFIRIVTHPKIFTPPAAAAEALESGSQWVTSDRHFARLPGLR